MPTSSITINGITGTSPYNITLCDTDPVSPTCVWIAQITDLDLPYTFNTPISLQYTTSFSVKIVDSGFPCTIITPPILRTLNPCYPVYIDATNNEVYSFDPSSYVTSSYFNPGVQIDAMTRNDDKLWIYDSSLGWIYEYDTTGYTTPTLIRQIDTTVSGIDIYGMCVFSSSTELLTLSSTGDINVVDISTNIASKSFLYSIAGTPYNDCNLLRDDNIGITYMKTSLNGFKAFYDDGTQYSTATWPSGNQKGFFRDSSTAEIYGVNNTGGVYKIPQPPGSVTPSSITSISPDNLVSGGLGQSNTCIPSVSSFKISMLIQNPLTGYSINYTIGYSATSFNWINWGDSDYISGGTTFGSVGNGSNNGHKYTPVYSGDLTIYSYDGFAGMKSLDTSLGFNATGITQTVTTSELKKITGLEEYYNFGFGYFQLSYFSGLVSDFPTGMTKILANRCNPLSGYTSDFPSNMTFIYLDGTLPIYGNFSSLPSQLYFLGLSTTSSNLSGTTLDLPRYLTSLYLTGSNKLSGSTYDLPSGLTNMWLRENNTVYGSTYDLPSGLTSTIIWGTNTISGNTLGLPSGLTYLDIRGNNIISGNTSGMPTGLTINVISGNNTISGDTSGLPRSGNTTIYGFNTISGNISGLPNSATSIDIRGNNTISGDTSGLPNSIQTLTILQGGGETITSGVTISGNISGFTGTSLSSIYIAGSNTISGNTSNIPTTTSFKSISLWGDNTLTGDITNIPPNITQFRVFGQNTIGGNISGLNTSTLRYFDVGGNNTISGGFSGFPITPGILVFKLKGGNIDLTPGSANGMALPSGIGQFYYEPTGSGLSSSDVDSILFAATAQTSWVNPGNGYSRSIYLRGANSAPTAASLAARLALTGSPYNLTVFTN